jgi:hypothetical protein
VAEARKTKAGHLDAMPVGITGGITAQELRDLIESLHPHQAATDPAATDDSSLGFDVGHYWVNTSTSPRKYWVCLNNTAGAAVWVQLGVSGGTGAGTKHDHRFLYEKDDKVWRDVDNLAQDRTWVNPTTFRSRSQPRVLPPLNATTGLRGGVDTYEAAFSNPRAVLVVSDVDAPAAVDDALQSRLEKLGFDVTLQSDEAAAQTSGFEVAIISESCASGTLPAGWGTTTIPVLLMELGFMDTMRLVDADTSVTLNTLGTQLNMVNGAHAAAGDLVNGLVTVYSASSEFAHADKAGLPAGGTVIAEKSDDTTEATVVVYENGATLTTGTAPARRAVYGFGEAAHNWTDDGAALFDSLIYWVGGYQY